jgi:hypothetical protein
LLDLSFDELLEQVEAVAAAGSARAERLLEQLIAEEAETGGLSVVSRLACTPVLRPGRFTR